MSSRKRERIEQTSHKVIEKRRRDRINNCLFELSQTVPAAFSKQTSGKLEKAEILEMTVEYLRAVQTTEIGMRFDNGEWFSADIWGDFAHHYQTGYSECVREVLKYMADVEGLSVGDTRCARLVSFLHNRFRSDAAASAGTPVSTGNGNSVPVSGSGFNMAGSLTSYAASRNGIFGGCAGMATSTSSRDTMTVLNSAVKTVPSSVGGSSSFDTRLFAFAPCLSQAAITNNAAAAGSRTSPLYSSTSLAALNVAPASPFRSLPPLSVPAMDLLKFPPGSRDVSAFVSRPNVAGVCRSGNDVFAVDPHPGLGLSAAAVRKTVCSSV